MSKAERTRKFIVEKAAPIINRKGMAGTSLTDIMQATKLAKGGIYGNFENKEEICHEAFLYLSRQLSSQLDNAVSKGKNVREKLFNLLDVYNGIDWKDGGCPMLNFGVESDDTKGHIIVHVRKEIRSSQKRIYNILQEGIAKGEVSGDLNVKHFSMKVFAMLEGAILCRQVLGNVEQMTVITECIKQEFQAFLL